MPAYVYATAAIPAAIAVGDSIQVVINNRNITSESYRALIWNMDSSLPEKQLIAQAIADINPNASVNVTLTALLSATSIENEIRLTNPNMDITPANATGGFIPVLSVPWSPGNFFADSSQTEGIGGPQPIPCGVRHVPGMSIRAIRFTTPPPLPLIIRRFCTAVQVLIIMVSLPTIKCSIPVQGFLPPHPRTGSIGRFKATIQVWYPLRIIHGYCIMPTASALAHLIEFGTGIRIIFILISLRKPSFCECSGPRTP